jgi:hypothetical protein
MNREWDFVLRAVLGLGLISFVTVAVVSADDRDLLRNSSEAPYMSIIMDTSGSMHWTPACTEEDAGLDIDPFDGKCTQECTLSEDDCRRICPDQGCVEYSVQYDAENLPPEVEIIVDNTDTAGVQVTGDWGIGGLNPWIGENYFHNRNTGQGSKSVLFTPDLPKESTYHVYLYWSSNNTRASNVPIDIVHKDGTTTVTANQRQGGGEYNFLGTYDFEAGTAGSVLIRTDGTNGYVAVDALRFFSFVKPDAPPLVCVRDNGYRCQQPLCPDGDCFAPLAADDPTSKFYQAKQALYEVLENADNIHFGFGSYEQDNVRFKSKHWLYRVSPTKPESEGFAADTPQDLFWDSLPLAVPFPQEGGDYVFGNGPPYDASGRGDGWNCASDSNYPGKGGDPDGDAGHVGCFWEEPADANNSWELERLRRIPKLGRLADQDTTAWYRRDGVVYRLVFRPALDSMGLAFEYGDPVVAMNIERTACATADCSGGTPETKTVYFDLVSDFAPWEGNIRRPPMRGSGYFAFQTNVRASNTCNGLEPNDDRDGNVDPDLSNSNDDTWWDYTFKWPTTVDPRGNTVLDANGDPVDWFDVGDFIPLDWQTTHNRLVQERMAPSIVAGAFDPDFRTATYWQDDHLSTSDPTSAGNRRLRLKDEDERPLLAFGSTPIGGALRDFREWYEDWSVAANERDIDWACRQKYVLFLTDGNETCGGDPCDAAAQLLLAGVKTYVVGFGLDDSSSNLGCIALQGGTNEPILPRNKDELVEALREIFAEVRAESRSFASASIPAIQSSAADLILLSSFVPLPSSAFWPGQIDVYRKPVPLLDGRPNPTIKCGPARQSACHVHDVGQVLLEQVPDDLNASTADLGLGDSLNERRVIYETANYSGKVPADLLLFRQPDRGPDGTDLEVLEDLGDVVVDPDTMAEYYANTGGVDADFIEGEVIDLMVETLREKDLDLPDDDRDAYVLGDIFHANPEVISGPSRIDYFGLNICGIVKNGPNNCVVGEDRGYRTFTRQNAWRRRLLISASNDGQLHFFDAGTRQEASLPTVGGQTETRAFYTDGTGRELFSYLPRLTLPVLREQVANDQHIFSVDGSFSVSDVFIDPQHDDLDVVDADDREWRTVLVAGLREAGDRYLNANSVEDFVRGYYALDITQPDILKEEDDQYVPVNQSLAKNTADLPSCMNFDYNTTGEQRVVTTGNGDSTVVPCRYPFPAALWSFTDAVEGGYFLDEENNGVGNGLSDLGDTWSQPVIGQIAVSEGGSPTVKHVAIFGGGLDPIYKDDPQRGTWLYMVDVETGKAIYKRELEGAAPAQPAVLDTNRDGIFDVIYVGTTAGILYKVDLASEIPELQEKNVRDSLLPDIGPGPAVKVIRVNDNAWEPFPILVTKDGADSGDPVRRAPIYQTPTVFPIPRLGTFGIAVGTGDRENLWGPSEDEGRLYVIVDERFTASQVSNLGACNSRIPIEDGCLEQIAWDSDPPVLASDPTQIDNTIDYVVSPSTFLHRGWTMTFPVGFRMTNDPFIASGILFFSFFQPIVFIPDLQPSGDPTANLTVCARTGITRSFVVLARNANPVARLSGDPQASDPEIDGVEIDVGDGGAVDPGDSSDGNALLARDRYHKIGEFTTAPFIDQVSSQNAPPGQGSGSTFADLVDPELERTVREVVMSSYPRGSRFNDAFRTVVGAVLNSTGITVYATVPQALYPGDWRADHVDGLPRGADDEETP